MLGFSGYAPFILLAVVYMVLQYRIAARELDVVRWRRARQRLRVMVPGARGERARVAVRGDGLEALELAFDAGAGTHVAFHSGQGIVIEKVEGGREEDGAFTVPAGTWLWVLDAPPSLELAQDAERGVRLVPKRAAPYPLTTEAPPVESDVVRESLTRGTVYRGSGASNWPLFLGVALVIVTAVAGADATPPGAWFPVVWWVGLGVLLVATGVRVRKLQGMPDPPEDAPRETGEGRVTMSAVDEPLWTHGARGAQRWVLPAKREDAPQVFVVAWTRGSTRSQALQHRLLGVAHAIAEEIELTTDRRARAATPVYVGRERPVPTRWASPPPKQLEVWLEAQDPCALLVWGEPHPDVDDGYVLHLQEPKAGSKELVAKGTLDDVVGEAMRWIREHLAEDRPRPEGLGSALPKPEHQERWLEVLGDHERVMLAKPPGMLLPPLAPEEVDGKLDDALAAARAIDHPQAWLLAMSMGMEAHKQGVLSDASRAKLRDVIAELDGSAPIATRLVPCWLLGIGEPERAAERAERDLEALGGPFRAPSDAYGTWLRAIIDEAKRASAAR